MRILTYIVTAADAGRAVRSVVPRRFSLGQHAFRRLKVQESILANGRPVRADYILREGEIIEIRLPDDEAGEIRTESSAVHPDLPPSFIRYCDDDLIIAANGTPLKKFHDLTRVLYSTGVGNAVELTVIRDNQEITVSILLYDRLAQ